MSHLGYCIAPDMLGMGDSAPLPESAPGKYKFATHRDYLFEPGAICANSATLELVRGFENRREVMVYGGHYVQEVSPTAIGRALAEWLPTLG